MGREYHECSVASKEEEYVHDTLLHPKRPGGRKLWSMKPVIIASLPAKSSKETIPQFRGGAYLVR
jgi:hypothetical protein